MKKLVCLTAIMMCVSSLCFAQQYQSTTKAPAAVAQNKTLSGKIDSIVMADPVKGTKSKIVVSENSGTTKTFTVGTSTKLYDSSMNVISLDKLSKDMNVQVEYQTTASGSNEAVSIKVSK